MSRVSSALLICLLATGCSPMRPPVSRPALEQEGTLVLYADPFPPEAGRLQIVLRGIAAVGEDGSERPLTLHLTALGGDSPGRQRRLAAGNLPAGRYSGLAIGTAAASLTGEQGAAALLTPPETARVAVPFSIEARRAAVLSLRLDYRDAVSSGFRFTPAFTAAPPVRPAPGLLGVASSRGADAVTLFDKVSGRIVGIVPTGRHPAGLALDAGRLRVYVAASGDDAVEAVGLLEQSVLGRVQLRGGDEPTELALAPDGRTLLSADAGSSTVSVLDALSLAEVGRIQVGNGPRSVIIDGAGRRAYVFNDASSTVTVLDVGSRRVVATIATEAGPFRGQINRAGDRLYVIHRSSPYLTIIDTAALAVTSRVYVGTGALAIRVDAQTDRIYLSRSGTGAVEIFDPLSLLPVDTVPAEGDASYLAIDDEGNNLYLALSAKGVVQVIRLVGKETTARAEVGEEPFGVTLLGER